MRRHKGSTLFAATGGVAVFCDGGWYTQKAGEGTAGKLVLAGHKTVSGPTDPAAAALGAYTGVELSWTAGKTKIITTAKNFAASDTVTFEYLFPVCSRPSWFISLRMSFQ